MPLTRLDLKNWIKSARGLERDVEDGLLPDTLLHEAIDDAIQQVCFDCNLLPVEKKFALRDGQYQYPMPEDLMRIRGVWFIDDNGTYIPLKFMGFENTLNYQDPVDNTGDPVYYTYAPYQSRVFDVYAAAEPVYDYIDKSNITTGSIRTVIDSGINFGKTLDGRRISPNDIVHNLTDGSYGYVDVLDITNNRTTGTATANTSSTILEDDTKNFVTLGVLEGDVICTPSTGNVTSYAFVTAVAATQLTYADMRGSATTFSVGDTYKVGIADRIRLSLDTPHPGLRDGATNDFTIGAIQATITGTTFTDTTVTGSATTGSEAGMIAIASGGSHGEITAVDDNELTVDMWVGGNPAAAETVTVRSCDQYQVDAGKRTERVLWIRPTPSSDDTVGSESIYILYNSIPDLPQNDYEHVEIPQLYETPLKRCLRWKVAELAGHYSEDQIANMETLYKKLVAEYKGDVFDPPIAPNRTVWQNRFRSTGIGRAHQTPNGLVWEVDL